MRLNKPKTKLMVTKKRIISLGNTLKITEKTTATAKFEAGPAKATIALSRLGCWKFKGFIGVGLAHPNTNLPWDTINNKIGTITVPTGSIWAVGFSVTLPSSLAVGSPSRLAKYAWAASCREITKAKIIKKARTKKKIVNGSVVCKRAIALIIYHL